MHKSYADHHRLFKEFQVREHVYLRIKTRKRPLRIGSCENMTLRYCGPVEILERIGLVAYRLALPPTMKFCDALHVSLLKRYVKDVHYVIDWFVLQVKP